MFSQNHDNQDMIVDRKGHEEIVQYNGRQGPNMRPPRKINVGLWKIRKSKLFSREEWMVADKGI